jgi:hypothetical protein
MVYGEKPVTCNPGWKVFSSWYLSRMTSLQILQGRWRRRGCQQAGGAGRGRFAVFICLGVFPGSVSLPEDEELGLCVPELTRWIRWSLVWEEVWVVRSPGVGIQKIPSSYLWREDLVLAAVGWASIPSGYPNHSHSGPCLPWPHGSPQFSKHHAIYWVTAPANLCGGMAAGSSQKDFSGPRSHSGTAWAFPSSSAILLTHTPAASH